MHSQTTRHPKTCRYWTCKTNTHHSIRKRRSRLPLRQLMHPWRSRINAKRFRHAAWVSERTHDKDGSLRQSLSYAFRNKTSCCLLSHEKYLKRGHRLPGIIYRIHDTVSQLPSPTTRRWCQGDNQSSQVKSNIWVMKTSSEKKTKTGDRYGTGHLIQWL